MSGESWCSTIIREAVEGTSAADAVNAVMPGGMAVAGAVKAAAHAAVGLGAVGSWSFDREEIEAIIADWKELAEQLREDRATFSQAETASYAPSNDEPSNRFVKSLQDGLAAIEKSNKSMQEYVDGFIEKLEEAKRSIGRTDDENANALGSANVNEV